MNASNFELSSLVVGVWDMSVESGCDELRQENDGFHHGLLKGFSAKFIHPQIKNCLLIFTNQRNVRLLPNHSQDQIRGGQLR
jgi:hypothetical protein